MSETMTLNSEGNNVRILQNEYGKCELTFNYKDEAFTDSTILAKGAGIEHRAVIQLITTHLDDVSEFGRVTFQMLPFETNGGIQKIKICRLNREQATFVISLIPPDANQGGIAVVEAYGICSKDSNAMKSENPNSGFYKAETSRTLDTSDQSPAKNQGGIAIVAVEGNGTRPSHHGNGYSEEGVGYTLNTTEQHGVAYGIDRATYNMGQNAQYAISIQEEVEPTMVAKGPGAVAHPTYCTSKSSFHTTAEKELANTLVASDYKDPPTVNDTDDEMEYIVRRLTPTECARLQGFPDFWCSDLSSENPTDEEIAKWREIFKEYDEAVGKKSKPKSDNQIRKWLQNPHSDSAEYKMWGNGVSLPVVFFVLSGIKWAADENISRS